MALADGQGGHSRAPFEVACVCSGDESHCWIEPKACVHVLGELFFVVALIDGAGQVV